MAAKIISICSFKGGVGKSSLAHNLSNVWARRGLKVLVVDLDPQANLTEAMLGRDELPVASIRDVLLDDSGDTRDLLEKAIVTETHVPDVHLLPGDVRLTALEDHIKQNNVSPALVLVDRLAPVLDHYDLIVIDTPPTLGLYPTMALAMSDYAYVPVAGDSRWAMLGMQDMNKLIQRVTRQANPNLQLGGAVVVRYDGRLLACRQVLVETSALFPVLATTIPGAQLVPQGQLQNKTAIQMDRKASVSQSFFALATEIQQQLGLSAAKGDEQ